MMLRRDIEKSLTFFVPLMTPESTERRREKEEKKKEDER
jgi:hypothetical protein